MPAQLRHFAICVSDLKKSQAVYEKAFGFKKAGEETLSIGSAVYMSDGVINLALLKFSGDAGAGVKQGARTEQDAVLEDVIIIRVALRRQVDLAIVPREAEIPFNKESVVEEALLPDQAGAPEVGPAGRVERRAHIGTRRENVLKEFRRRENCFEADVGAFFRRRISAVYVDRVGGDADPQFVQDFRRGGCGRRCNKRRGDEARMHRASPIPPDPNRRSETKCWEPAAAYSRTPGQLSSAFAMKPGMSFSQSR